MRPTCVLLDADVIIEAHEMGVWLRLVDACRIVVPSIVVNQEALFYSRKLDGVHEDINLPRLAGEGRLVQMEATAGMMQQLYSKFDNCFVDGLHSGEAEGLALLLAGAVPEALFCTGDQMAIRGLVLLGMAERGISFETLLGRLGLSRRLAKAWFSEARFQKLVQRASIDRIQGTGLA